MRQFHRHSDTGLSRRDWLRLSTAGVIGWSMSGWLEQLAAETAHHPDRRRSCILLWMNGGPSQLDTFDLKPDHENGGEFKEIATSVPGIRISEHLPKLAKQMDHLALIRSMRTREADHARGTFLMRTGHAPGGPIRYPPIGSLVAKELEHADAELPSYVSIAPYRFLSRNAYSPGFLGPQYAPLIVGENRTLQPTQDPDAYEQSLKVQDLEPVGVGRKQADARLGLLKGLEERFVAGRPGVASKSHQAAYQRAVRMMRSEAVKAFELDQEPDALRDAYGRNLFGQGCLLARRLVERGVPFVEVTLGGVVAGQVLGWDTHRQNFPTVQQLSEVLDAAWSTLMTALKEKGLLESTLIVWMGEFGRTPKINRTAGRDHWANGWTTVLGGGGIRGGRVVGRTSKDGMEIEDRPVSVNDLLATICLALGIDYRKYNMSNVGRPIHIVDGNPTPIKEILA